MAKSVIRLLPKDLPHASIYLDDLIEIEKILAEAFLKLPGSPSLSFEYEVGDKEVMTTHDDLVDQGGSYSNFAMNVVEDKSNFPYNRVLTFYGFLNPSFEAPRTLKDDRWGVFSKVEQVFRARRDPGKNLIESIPRVWAGVFLVTLSIGGGVLPTWLSRASNGRDPSRLIASVLFLLMMAAAGLAAYLVFKKNRVYLRFARQDQKARLAARKERIEKFVWLLVGATVGALFTLLADHLRR